MSVEKLILISLVMTSMYPICVVLENPSHSLVHSYCASYKGEVLKEALHITTQLEQPKTDLVNIHKTIPNIPPHVVSFFHDTEKLKLKNCPGHSFIHSYNEWSMTL